MWILTFVVSVAKAWAFGLAPAAALYAAVALNFGDLPSSLPLAAASPAASAAVVAVSKTVPAVPASVDLTAASQAFLAKYPDASRSTSAVWGEWVDSNVGAGLDSAGKIWNESPLKKDIDAVSAQPTSKVTSEFFGYIADRAGPNLAKLTGGDDLGSKIATKWSGEGTKFLESNPDLELSTSEYFSRAFGGVGAAFAEPVQGLPSLSLPSLPLDSVKVPSPADLPSVNLPDIDEISAATSRAGTVFNTKLAEKGVELQRNTEFGLSATGKAIDVITSDFTQNLPTVLDAAKKAPDAIKAGLDAKLNQFNAELATPSAPSGETVFSKVFTDISKGSSYKAPKTLINTDKISADFTRGANDFVSKFQTAKSPEISADILTQQVQTFIDSVKK